MPKPIPCPLCNQTDQVEKVSTLYLTSIGLGRHTNPGTAQTEELVINSELKNLPATHLRELGRRLAPPSGRTQALTRPIHPDMVVLALTMIAPVFLYGILNSQTIMLVPVIVLLAAFYIFYWWKRKDLVAKYDHQREARRTGDERIKRGIQRWMILYYCLRDDVVFEPRSSETTPADQIAGYLLRDNP